MVFARHSREGGNPEPFAAESQAQKPSRWIPAFAGMTDTFFHVEK
jgi:hypothetical protein